MSTERLPAPVRRQQLLDTALTVFATRGFHTASMTDVADAAGVTKPVLYQHFTSKRELFLELLDQVSTMLLGTLERAVAIRGGPRAQVEAGLVAWCRFVEDDRDAFTLLFDSDARTDPEFAEAARRVEATIAEEVAALLPAELDWAQRMAVAYALVGMAEVTSRRFAAGDLALTSEDLGRHLAELGWYGLRNLGTRPR